MYEIKITIESPELAAAISNLASAITRQNDLTDSPAIPAAKPGLSDTPAAPTAAPVVPAPVVPLPVVPAPASTTAAPVVPVAAPQYTFDMIAAAGQSLVDAGKINELQALLREQGVSAITELTAEQYGPIAAGLRALGAKI